MTINRAVIESISREDFAIIDGNIEPKRDLMLKLFEATGLNYDVDLLSATPYKDHIAITVKATLHHQKQNRTIEGLGACTTEETKRSGSRAYHDAIARAETRAFKRAVEAAVGLPLINQIILKLFGGYDAASATAYDVEGLTRCIQAQDTAEGLILWAKEHAGVIRKLDTQSQATLREVYRAQYQILIDGEYERLEREAIQIEA